VLGYLDRLQQSEEEEFLQKKILCIIEGDLEFRYITKIFTLYGFDKGCYALSENLIKIAWGKNNTPNKNIVNKKCVFKGGGSSKGRKVPYPALDAFEMYEDDLSIFDAVIVFFDEDKDRLINHEVENYFKNVFKNFTLENVLVVSIPCFESTLIDYCHCGKCRDDIDNIEDEQYPCEKYKNNFSTLECFNGAKHLVSRLNIKEVNILKSKTSTLNDVHVIIEKFMNKK